MDMSFSRRSSSPAASHAFVMLEKGSAQAASLSGWTFGRRFFDACHRS